MKEITSKPKNKFNIGPKTYTWIKYIATISSVIFLLLPTLMILFLTESIKLQWDSGFEALYYGLWGSGTFILAIFLTLRIHLFFVTDYKYTKKEKIYFWLAMGFYIGNIFLTLSLGIVYTVIFSVFQSYSLGVWGVLLFTTIPMAFFILVFNILAAVFESFSRIGEQQFLYQKTQGPNQVLSKRTSEGEKLVQESINSHKHKKVDVEVKDKDALDDFFKDQDKDK